jgi:hypothetical protein
MSVSGKGTPKKSGKKTKQSLDDLLYIDDPDLDVIPKTKPKKEVKLVKDLKTLNENLSKKIGYIPYREGEESTIICNCCDKNLGQMTDEVFDLLSNTRFINEEDQHICVGCSIQPNGTNLGMAIKAKKMAKALNLEELAGIRPNKYYSFKDNLVYLDKDSDKIVEITFPNLEKSYNEFISKPLSANLRAEELEEVKEEENVEEKEVISETNKESVMNEEDEKFFEGADEDANLGQENDDDVEESEPENESTIVEETPESIESEDMEVIDEEIVSEEEIDEEDASSQEIEEIDEESDENLVMHEDTIAGKPVEEITLEEVYEMVEDVVKDENLVKEIEKCEKETTSIQDDVDLMIKDLCNHSKNNPNCDCKCDECEYALKDIEEEVEDMVASEEINKVEGVFTEDDFDEIISGNGESILNRKKDKKTEDWEAFKERMAKNGKDGNLKGIIKDDMERNPDTSSYRNGNYHPNGAYSTEPKMDKFTEEMLENNKKEKEYFDLFAQTEDGKMAYDKNPNTLSEARTNRIIKNFMNDENPFYNLVCLITETFKNARVHDRNIPQIESRLMLDETTHEVPVVDFLGNIRIICVDTKSYGCSYHVEKYINDLKQTFKFENDERVPATAKKRSYVVYTDMVNTIDGRLRVAAAIVKQICFNMKILSNSLVRRMSIMNEANRYYYTTSEYDDDTITKFIKENNPHSSPLPSTDKIALIVEGFVNTDERWQAVRDLNARMIVDQGGELDYHNFASSVMAAAFEITCIPRPSNNAVDVIIVNYTEIADVWIQDGFSILSALTKSFVHDKYGMDVRVNLMYEFNWVTIPSPTVMLEFAKQNLVSVEYNPRIAEYNKYLAGLAKGLGGAATYGNEPARVWGTINNDGDVFNSSIYQQKGWVTFIFGNEKNDFGTVRIDPRNLGHKQIAQTFDKYGTKLTIAERNDAMDQSKRAFLLERYNMKRVVQPAIWTYKVDDEHLEAVWDLVEKRTQESIDNNYYCSGLFSLAVANNGMKQTNVYNDRYYAQEDESNRKTRMDYFQRGGNRNQPYPQQNNGYYGGNGQNYYDNGRNGYMGRHW